MTEINSITEDLVKIIDVPVQTFQRLVSCNSCNKGHMVSQSLCLLVNPPRYEHICDVCGNKMFFAHSYPQLVTKPVHGMDNVSNLVNKASL